MIIVFGEEKSKFVGGSFFFGRIYPKFSAFRILMGLVQSNRVLMFSLTLCTWLGVLIFQNTLSGLDLTRKFEWLNCDGENATWMGGFDWENC